MQLGLCGCCERAKLCGSTHKVPLALGGQGDGTRGYGDAGAGRDIGRDRDTSRDTGSRVGSGSELVNEALS